MFCISSTRHVKKGPLDTPWYLKALSLCARCSGSYIHWSLMLHHYIPSHNPYIYQSWMETQCRGDLSPSLPEIISVSRSWSIHSHLMIYILPNSQRSVQHSSCPFQFLKEIFYFPESQISTSPVEQLFQSFPILSPLLQKSRKTCTEQHTPLTSFMYQN